MNKYDEFIQSIRESRENVWFEYSERHHIIPRCLGGTDDEDNLIYLTYREHFIAHKLLCEEYPGNRDLITALNFMAGFRKECTPEEYEDIKRRFSESQRGDLNPMRNLESQKKSSKSHTGLKHKEDTKKKISEAVSGENNPFYGKHHTDDARIKISEMKSNPSEEYRRSQSEKMKGNKNHLGHLHSSESKKKMSISAKNRAPMDEETRRKVSIARKNAEFHLFCKNCGEEFIGKSPTKKYCKECE